MAEAAQPDLRADLSKLYSKTSSFEERLTNLEEALSSLEESLGASANLLETLVEFKTYAQEHLKSGGGEKLGELEREVSGLREEMKKTGEQAKSAPAGILPSDLEKLKNEIKGLNEKIIREEGAQEGLRKDIELIDFQSIQDYVNNLENSILKIIESQEKLQQKIESSDIKEIERKIKDWKETAEKTDAAQIAADVGEIKKTLAKARPEKTAGEVELLKGEIEELKKEQKNIGGKIEGAEPKETAAKILAIEERLFNLARIGEDFRILQNNVLQLSDRQAAGTKELDGIKKAQEEAAPRIEKTGDIQAELISRIKGIEDLKAEMEADRKARQSFLETLGKTGFTAKAIEDLKNLMEEGTRVEESLRKYSTDKKLDVDLIVDSITRKTYDKLAIEMNTLTSEINDVRNHFTTESNRIDSDIRGLADGLNTREEVINNRLGERIKDLNTLHNTLANDLSNLRTNAEGQLAKFGTTVRNLNEVIVGKLRLMDGKIGTNAEAMNTVSRSLRSDIEGIKEAVPGQFAEMEKKLSDLSKSVGSEKMKEMEDRVAEDRILIGKMTVLIKKMQENYNPAKINETRIKVERLESILNSIEGGKPEMLNKIAGLEQQMSKIDVGRIMSLIDKIETVKDEIAGISTKISPDKYHAKLNELESRMDEMHVKVQDHSRINETVQDLNVKLAVMKDHVRTIKEEVQKKKAPTRDSDYLILE